MRSSRCYEQFIVKVADAAVFQVQDGICYGVFLSAGHRVEHESGIEGLVRRLGLRQCPGGMLISFDREADRVFFFGTAQIDGELHAVWQLEDRWSDATGRRPKRSPHAVKRRLAVLNALLAGSDDTPARDATTRGFWDGVQFAITTYGDRRVAYLETLHLAALAGDLAPTYLDDEWKGRRASEQGRDGGLDQIGAGLGLFAAGLTPEGVRARIIEHQSQRGFQGRERFRIIGRESE